MMLVKKLLWLSFVSISHSTGRVLSKGQSRDTRSLAPPLQTVCRSASQLCLHEIHNKRQEEGRSDQIANRRCREHHNCIGQLQSNQSVSKELTREKNPVRAESPLHSRASSVHRWCCGYRWKLEDFVISPTNCDVPPPLLALPLCHHHRHPRVVRRH